MTKKGINLIGVIILLITFLTGINAAARLRIENGNIELRNSKVAAEEGMLSEGIITKITEHDMFGSHVYDVKCEFPTALKLDARSFQIEADRFNLKEGEALEVYIYDSGVYLKDYAIYIFGINLLLTFLIVSLFFGIGTILCSNRLAVFFVSRFGFPS